jgi:14-3-3 protein epsilon
MKKGAIEAYKKAEDASKDLKAYNSVKLGLALNYSVFQYEVMKQPEKACRIS